jgi:hypothetical protein
MHALYVCVYAHMCLSAKIIVFMKLVVKVMPLQLSQ